MSAPLQVTVIAKSGGPLTKRISLATDGSLRSDGSACVMSRGTAKRFTFSRLEQFADLIEHFAPHQAICLGGLRSDLPDEVSVTTRQKLNGAREAGVIARTSEYLIFPPGKPALALVDHDTKGMPPSVAERIENLGGLLPALLSVLPALAGVARVVRRSTSAGLFRTDTGHSIAGSDGVHAYVIVKNGADGDRFLKTLHARCWLAGLGWLMVGAGGQLLERSIIDRVVGSPERLVFEGRPLLDPPLAQDQDSRRPLAIEGEALDTVAACPPLTPLEKAKLRELHAKEVMRLAPEAAKEKGAFIDWQASELAQRTGMDLRRAHRTIKRQCEGVLLPDVVLQFDDDDLAGTTVADVLADPARFEGATLADPLEGTEYGRCKARIMRRGDGTVWINSFAHGRTVYELKSDFRTAKTELEKAANDEAPETFVRLALTGDLGEDEIEELRNIAHRRTGINKRTLDNKLKSARQRVASEEARQVAERRTAERQDPRPQLPVPLSDAEWLPTMQAVNDVLGRNCATEPPTRNVDHCVALVRARRVPSLHFLTRKADDDTGS